MILDISTFNDKCAFSCTDQKKDEKRTKSEDIFNLKYMREILHTGDLAEPTCDFPYEEHINCIKYITFTEIHAISGK